MWFDSLKTKIIIPVVAILMVLVALIVVFVNVSVRNLVVSLTNDRIASMSQMANTYIESLSVRNQITAYAITGSSTLIESVQNWNNAANIEQTRQNLLQYLSGRMGELGVDAFVVFDQEGNVILRTHDPDHYGDNLRATAHVTAALGGTIYTLYSSTPALLMGLTSAAPIWDNGEVIGAISAIVYYHTDEFVRGVSKAFNAEITIFAGDVRVATTIVDRTGQQIIGTRLEEQYIVDIVLNQGQYYIGTLELSGVPFHTYYFPLFGWGGTPVGIFFVGFSIEQTVAMTVALLRNIIIISVTGILIAAAVVFLLILNMLKPLKNLAITSKDIADGNLDVSIETDRNDEIGQVFHSFSNVVSSLKALIEEAKSSSRAKSNFLAKMSHEIRTPMNAIIGMTELILKEDIPPSAHEQAMTIKQSGSHLLSIINDILDFSKIERGKLELVNTEYLFHSIVNDVVNIINARMTNSDVQFIAYMERDIPNIFFGDEMRLRQVLLNLLSNAVKYTKEGRITLNISWERTGTDTMQLIMQVKDTGIGIKPENLKTLFDEFQQFDQETNRNIEGTGLGLTIVNNLMKLMGGDIKVESTYGLGSIFTITLPQKFNPSESWQENWENEGEVSPDGKSVFLTGRTRIEANVASKDIQYFIAPDARVLVVDDIHTNLNVARGLLKSYGVKVDICLSGREAIEAVQDEDYDLVFMDHMMPEMDGIEAVSIIRAIDGGRKYANLPIIALSANAIVGAREMFLQNGLDDFLAKPIELDKLHLILEKWIPKEKQKEVAPSTNEPTT